MIVVKLFGTVENRKNRIQSALEKFFNPAYTGWGRYDEKEKKKIPHSDDFIGRKSGVRSQNKIKPESQKRE